MVEWKKLGEVCNLVRGKVISKDYLRDNEGKYPVYSSQTANNGIFGCINSYMFDGDYLTWTTDGAYAGTIFRRKGKFNITNVCGLIDIKDNNLNQDFLYYWLSLTAKDYVNEGMGNPKLMSNVAATIIIPLPSLSEQERIVGILDTFTSSIENLKAQISLRRKQYEHYRDKLLDLEGKPGVEMKTLGEVCDNLDYKRKPITSSKRVAGVYPYYGASGIVDYIESYIFDGEYLLVSEDGANLIARTSPIAFSIKGKNWVNNHAHVLEFNNRFTQKFVEIYLNMIDLSPWINGAAQPKLNQANLNVIPIPLPSLEEQSRIVSILDEFEASIKNLEAQLKAREKQYEYYRNKLLTFD